MEAESPSHTLHLHCEIMIYSAFSLNGQWINDDILMWCISEHSMGLSHVVHFSMHPVTMNTTQLCKTDPSWENNVMFAVICLVLWKLKVTELMQQTSPVRSETIPSPFLTRRPSILGSHCSHDVLVNAWVWIWLSLLTFPSYSPFLLTFPVLHNQMPGEAKYSLYACQHWSAG